MLAVILTVLVVSEGVVRALLPRVSADWRNFEQFARLTDTNRNDDGPQLLFLGNSLTGRSIVPYLVQAKLEHVSGARLTVDKIATDDSNVTEWLYLIQGKLTSATSRPDLLVIGYAEDQLSDRAPVRVDRLAGYYGGLRIAPEAFQSDIHDTGSRTDFVLSSFSVLYANRDRVRTQLLDKLVPGYRAYAQQANHAAKTAGVTARITPGYERLRRLLVSCRDNKIPVAIVAMPIPYEYKIDAEVSALAREYNARFYDMSRVESLHPSYFTDGYHLDDAGARIYSERFATALAESSDVLRHGTSAYKAKAVVGL